MIGKQWRMRRAEMEKSDTYDVVIARSAATRQSPPACYPQEIAALPSVARNDSTGV